MGRSRYWLFDRVIILVTELRGNRIIKILNLSYKNIEFKYYEYKNYIL